MISHFYSTRSRLGVITNNVQTADLENAGRGVSGVARGTLFTQVAYLLSHEPAKFSQVWGPGQKYNKDEDICCQDSLTINTKPNSAPPQLVCLSHPIGFKFEILYKNIFKCHL